MSTSRVSCQSSVCSIWSSKKKWPSFSLMDISRSLSAWRSRGTSLPPTRGRGAFEERKVVSSGNGESMGSPSCQCSIWTGRSARRSARGPLPAVPEWPARLELELDLRRGRLADSEPCQLHFDLEVAEEEPLEVLVALLRIDDPVTAAVAAVHHRPAAPPGPRRYLSGRGRRFGLLPLWRKVRTRRRSPRDWRPTRQNSSSTGNPSSGISVGMKSSRVLFRLNFAGVRYSYIRSGPKMSAPWTPVASRMRSSSPKPIAKRIPPWGVAYVNTRATNRFPAEGRSSRPRRRGSPE